jgi:probable HAF family extracellular repeat protein
MTSRVFTLYAMILVAALVPSGLAAQQHHHYKPIDLGTLGGPQSGLAVLGQTSPLNTNESSAAPATQMLSAAGVVTGAAELNTPDPYKPFCLFSSDCMLAHTFLFRDGRLIDLGAVPGVNDSFPGWVNDRGEVAGTSYNGTDLASGLPLLEGIISKDGSLVEIGSFPGGNQSFGNSINNAGVVVGGAVNGIPDPFPNIWPVFFFFNTTEIHAFRWHDGVLADLGTLGGPDSIAIFVNERGQIAGQSLTNSTVNPSTGQPTQHPFLWENGKMIDLGTLGGTFGFPNALNNRGEVVGLMNLAGDANFHPFLWQQGSLIDLGTLGGNNAFASWISDAGEVVGTSGRQGDETHHAFLWKNGRITDLGTPGSDPCSDGSVVNSRGQAVGITSDCHGGFLHTFLWENGGPIVELQNLVLPGSSLTVADNVFINDRGEIATNASLPNGDIHAVLLIPCDENHRGVDGCDYGMVDAGAIPSEASSGPVKQAPETGNTAANRMRSRFRGRLMP